MTEGGCSIVWFRRDLRVEDNPALLAGVRAGVVICVFIWAPEEEGHYYPGRVSRWWLKHSLAQLDSSLRSLGTCLVTKRSTDSVSSLLQVVKSTGATNLFFNHLYDPLSLVRDHRAKEVLTANGITVRSFNADLLYEPWEVVDERGQPFTTFTTFWERCLSMPFDPEAPLLPPKRIISGDVSQCPSDTLVFEDESERGSNALLARAWSPGWSSADKALTTFINRPLTEYSKNRRKADSATTSFLSPHLHFGEVSVRKVFHLVRIKQVSWANEGNTAADESCNVFLKSIGLREYSRYMSFNHPYSHERPLLAHLKFFPWVIDEGYFKSWRQGRTGYPLVDAGMRELWATGWLHDRIRVVVSSFFVKVLQLPWRWGMKYFWDTLLDADLESDALGWQYISGTLPDGREFDRIDNPQFEGYKFDPNGEYVRRWLPELARLPTEWIHHPWDAPETVLQAAGVELGSNYPLPIVEIDAAKARLQEALSQMWQQEAAHRAAIENGTEEGLGDSAETDPIAFPQDLQMDIDREPARNNQIANNRLYEDQMVPSITSTLFRVEDDETSSDLRQPLVEDGRAEVPRNVHADQEREPLHQGALPTPTSNNNNGPPPQVNIIFGLQNVDDIAESSSTSGSRGERSGGVVPVWSPSSSTFPDQFVTDEAGIGPSSSFLQRHPQSHQLVNWRRLSQTGLREEFWVDPGRSISKAYVKTDQAILSQTSDIARGGSTAVTAILINGRRLWIANLGDSRAVLSRGGQAIQMTVDHEPNTERGSIEDKGGFVSNMPGDVPRVNGQLAVSRAFGDKSLKSHLRSDPDVQDTNVDMNTEVLILASDGLWKVMSNQEAVDIARRIKDPQKAAKHLAAEALRKESKDDISCIVVRFR